MVEGKQNPSRSPHPRNTQLSPGAAIGARKSRKSAVQQAMPRASQFAIKEWFDEAKGGTDSGGLLGDLEAKLGRKSRRVRASGVNNLNVTPAEAKPPSPPKPKEPKRLSRKEEAEKLLSHAHLDASATLVSAIDQRHTLQM